MRTLKFRVYNHTRNEMTYDIESIDFNKGKIEQINTAQDRILFPDKEAELMMWTGLTDRSGKEIYEGDIIASDNYSWTVDFGWSSDGEYGLLLKLNPNTKPSTIIRRVDHIHEYMEVIGNIYENPELLKNGRQ